MPTTEKLTGPKSHWHPKKLREDQVHDLKTINAWAGELFKWAQIVTDQARKFEATQVTPTNHIPDPPPPPFSDPGT